METPAPQEESAAPPAAPGEPRVVTHRPPTYGELLRYAVPMMVALMTTALMGVIDTAFMGRLGTAQLAAVPTAVMMYWVGWVPAHGIVRSAMAFISRAYGARRPERAGFILAHYRLLVAAMVPLLLAFVQLWPVVALIAGLNAEVAGYGRTYLLVRMWDAPFSLLLALYMAFYQALGNSRFPMLVAVGALLLNVVLDYGLIFGHFGLPALSVAGSGLATVLAQATGAAIIVGAAHLGAARHRYALRLRVRPSLAYLRDILRIGVPQGLGDFTEVGTWMLFFMVVGRLGENALAATNLGVQLTQLMFLPGYAVGLAAAAYMGRYLGARRPDLARRSTGRALAVAVLYMGAAGVPLWFFGEALARLFTADAEVIVLAGLMFKVMALYQPVDALGFVTRTALSGAGDTLRPMLALAACAVLVMVPASAGLSALVEPGLVGAWLGACCYMAVYAVLMQVRFRGGRWERIRIGAGTG